MFAPLFSRRRRGEADAHIGQWHTAIIFAIGLCAATAGLVWFAYIATRQWQRGTDLLQGQRAAEALALAHAAVIRDMKGAWVSLIVPINDAALDEDPPYDLLHQSAQAFAKFPYVESVMIWKGGPSERTYVFSRSDRQPPWDHSVHAGDPFPVLMQRDVAALAPVIDAARQVPTPATPFALFETSIDRVPYQVVAHLLFAQDPPHKLTRFVALTINLDWVRQNYFRPLLTQISSIGAVDDSLVIAVTDDHQQQVAATGVAGARGDERQRSFPFVFLEPTVLSAEALSRRSIKEYAVHVQRSRSVTAQAAFSGAFRILVLIALTAMASVVALLQTVRAVRASVRLATMKSEFVSAVTHELKTPLVTVRLIADTLARGRYASTEAIQEYARLLSQQATRLSHSIDHLLTYARYTDSTAPIAFEPVYITLADVVEDALDRFRPTLSERGFDVTIDVPQQLVQAWVDPRAVTQVLEILLDNAIKYSGDRRAITITAREEKPFIRLTVADRGIGIHPDDLAHVHERFFRGRNADAGGSGLGLAIAERIMAHHGGEMRIRSVPGQGTEVDLFLHTRAA
jgi:signal transduction histidine kinase